jgi:hypothetical protein
MPFADRALAQRLERNEVLVWSEYVDAPGGPGAAPAPVL